MKMTTGNGGPRPSTSLRQSGRVTVSDSLIELDIALASAPGGCATAPPAPPLPSLLLSLSVRPSREAVVLAGEPCTRGAELTGRHQ